MDFNSLYIQDNLKKYQKLSIEYLENLRKEFTRFTIFNPCDPEQVVNNTYLYINEISERDVIQIKDYNSKFNPHENVIKNIALINKKETAFIVSGHQPSAFGGPLFLFLKIISTISLCRKLNCKSDKVIYLPLFWNGSEDHNVTQFNTVTIPDKENDLQHFKADIRGSGFMSNFINDSCLKDLIKGFEPYLPETEFKKDLIDLLNKCSTIGSISESFSYLVSSWFGKYGLILIEPSCFRDSSAGYINKALFESSEINSIIEKDSLELQKYGYIPALPSDNDNKTLVYYVSEEGKRYRLFHAKDKRIFYSEDAEIKLTYAEIENKLKNFPQQFSPAAALRPIIQAGVLPVVLYVSGGGELAYHYQIRKLFEFFDVVCPGLIPRCSATIIKKNMFKKFKTLHLQPEDILSENFIWSNIVLKLNNSLAERQEAFADFNKHFELFFNAFKKNIQENGGANFKNLDLEKERFLSRLTASLKQYEKSTSLNSEVSEKQFNKIRKFIIPAESYQELSVWSIYFLCLYGSNLFDYIINNINPFDMRHFLIIPK